MASNRIQTRTIIEKNRQIYKGGSKQFIRMKDSQVWWKDFIKELEEDLEATGN